MAVTYVMLRLPLMLYASNWRTAVDRLDAGDVVAVSACLIPL